MLVFRITQTRYANTLSAPGVSGRWNSGGMQLVYTGGSAALSCLEVLAHKTGASLQSGNFSIATVEIPEFLVVSEILIDELSAIDACWMNPEQYPLTQAIGDQWILSQASAVLKVPSAIIPDEFNFLLNVNHPDFEAIKIVRVNRFSFDTRLKV